jgi:hypothetical protein
METCFFVPILPGKAEDALRFATELNTTRRGDYTNAQVTITREKWWIQETPHGSFMIVYFESPDAETVMGNLAGSTEPFDMWFKAQILELTGVDTEQPMPGGVPKKVLDWSKD